LLTIARSLNVEIVAPASGWIASFASSPRIVHIITRAVDISTGYEFGDEALSPVEGKIETIKQIDAGRGPYSSTDYIIVIRCGKLFVRITHVAPSVLPGDYVYVGDPIGRYLKTNSVLPYSPPHMHIEVASAKVSRCPNNIKKIFPAPHLIEFLKGSSTRAYEPRKLRARVVHASNDYTILQPVEGGAGLSVLASGKEAVLDAELRSKTIYVGLIPVDRKRLRPVGAIVFLGAKLGQIKREFRVLAIGVSAIGPYIYKYTDLEDEDPWNLAEEPPKMILRTAIEIRINGEKVDALRVFPGTLGCILAPRRIDDSYVDIEIRNIHPVLLESDSEDDDAYLCL